MDFALSLERLKNFPYDPVGRQIRSKYKGVLHRVVKKIPNRVCARTQPGFTPLAMSNESDAEPLKTIVSFMSSWNDLMMLRSLGGHPILGRILKRPSLLIRSIEGLREIYEGYKEWLP